MKFANWKCYAYRFYGSNKNYSYQELKDFFKIDGSNEILCKKDFESCKAGKKYMVIASHSNEYGFLIF